MATCRFCGEGFRNRQAVRAHLKACEAYQGAPEADFPKAEPIGGEGGGGFDPVEEAHRQLQTEEIRLKLRRVQTAHRALDAQEAERSRKAREDAEAARKREGDRELARARAQEEAARKEQRRSIIQVAKNKAVQDFWSLKHNILSEVQAQALRSIEEELASLPVDELPLHEVVEIAKGVRDRVYAPTIAAQDEAKRGAAEEKEKEWQATLEGWKRENARVERQRWGNDYASRELSKVPDLSWSEKQEILQRVEDELGREIMGDESRREVQDLVEDILLGEGIEEEGGDADAED
jgi:hypothetical protein